MILLANRKATNANTPINTMRLRMALCKEIPVDFMAANSYFSAKLPKTINEVTRTVNGSTKGINRGETYHKNLSTIHTSRSLPANSEM